MYTVNDASVVDESNEMVHSTACYSSMAGKATSSSDPLTIYETIPDNIRPPPTIATANLVIVNVCASYYAHNDIVCVDCSQPTQNTLLLPLIRQVISYQLSCLFVHAVHYNAAGG